MAWGGVVIPPAFSQGTTPAHRMGPVQWTHRFTFMLSPCQLYRLVQVTWQDLKDHFKGFEVQRAEVAYDQVRSSLHATRHTYTHVYGR